MGRRTNANPAGIVVFGRMTGRTSPSGRKRIAKHARPPAQVNVMLGSKAVTPAKGAGGLQVEPTSNCAFRGTNLSVPSSTYSARATGASGSKPAWNAVG